MPKQKTVDIPVTEPAAAAEVKKRSKGAPSKAKTPAATHKRASKKTLAVEPALRPTAEPTPVHIPTHEEVARLAYSYWEARGYQHGSAEADWLRAERELSLAK